MVSIFSDEELAKLTAVIEECQLSRDQAVARLVRAYWDLPVALDSRSQEAPNSSLGASAAWTE